MADLESDVVGQVARLPLKPSEANALLPLYEGISNALHAIHDRFGDKDIHEKGRIDIEILRLADDLEAVTDCSEVGGSAKEEDAEGDEVQSG